MTQLWLSCSEQKDDTCLLNGTTSHFGSIAATEEQEEIIALLSVSQSESENGWLLIPSVSDPGFLTVWRGPKLNSPSTKVFDLLRCSWQKRWNSNQKDSKTIWSFELKLPPQTFCQKAMNLKGKCSDEFCFTAFVQRLETVQASKPAAWKFEFPVWWRRWLLNGWMSLSCGYIPVFLVSCLPHCQHWKT